MNDRNERSRVKSNARACALLLGISSVGIAAAAVEAAAQENKAMELPPVSVQVSDKAKGNNGKKTKTAKKGSGKATASRAKLSGENASVAAAASAAPTSDVPGIPQPDAQGDIGYRATKSSSSTKTDTPLRNVPQSVSVVTDKQIRDQASQSIGDVIKYVPGIEVHHGEGNRDQVSIRGQVASTADFFVNGVRDDAQIFRDLYNTERLEILKGPAALAFGRGGAGGIVNRITKQADWDTHNEATVEFGSFDHRRVTTDFDKAISPGFAARVTSMYEDSGSYRDHVDLERWGVNPTFAFKPWKRTTVILDYEHFEDHRTADRGIPSERPAGFLGTVGPSPASASTFFGNPDDSFVNAVVDRTSATVEHTTDFGLKIRNVTQYANYNKIYQNIYPGGAYDPTTGLVPLLAYNNINNRENLFNQTDFIHKFSDGWTRHTLLAGAEFGLQHSFNFRHSGQFDISNINGQCAAFGPGNSLPNGTCFVSFTNPTIYSPPVSFATPTTHNRVTANAESFYVQDQWEIGRYLEIVGGVRHDTFGTSVTNLSPGSPSSGTFSQDDSFYSPRAGIIVKPTDSLSLYVSYSVTNLPASGDQFGSVTNATKDLAPERYVNKEVGLKWDITPVLAFTTAFYEVDRTNIRFAQQDGTFIQTGKSEVDGVEVTLTGYVTDRWQVAAGYGHQTGELTSATSATLPAGTPLPLLPSDTISLWNRYQVTRDWAAGVGVVHHTDVYASLQPETNLVKLLAYTTVDAALYYQINDHVRAQFNAINIFNENYIASAGSNDNLIPGATRTFYVSLTSSF
ncbi:TonB-dependent receptor [Hyphomicrobium denitrificans]|uniref:TonB-dependent receptor n=1 Tax=Hyphomicrobium denitrificans TaxID=53399 RepID=UPI00022E2440|nr:TonB-dependent siderophore receptor [Hyphomicrobium denitrificans]